MSNQTFSIDAVEFSKKTLSEVALEETKPTILIIGESTGIGKSAIMRALAERHGVEIQVIEMSVSEWLMSEEVTSDRIAGMYDELPPIIAPRIVDEMVYPPDRKDRQKIFNEFLDKKFKRGRK